MSALAVSVGVGGTMTLSPGAAAARRPHSTLHAFSVAIVPTLSNEALYLAQQRGYFKDVGLNVHINAVDAGPALVTGVMNGTYDVGSTALFPLFIAASKGAPLKVVTSLAQNRPGCDQSAVVVRKGSPIKTYRDLVGKTVATNALTSLTTLATQIAIAKQGGNPKGMKVISTPLNVALQEVAQGRVDAAILLTPFSTEATLDGLRDIGDAIDTMMPARSPEGVLFTSAHTLQAKKAELASFKTAVKRAQAQLDGNVALQRRLARSALGFSAKLAHRVAMPCFSAAFSMAATQRYANLVAKYGYTTKPVNVRAFFG